MSQQLLIVNCPQDNEAGSITTGPVVQMFRPDHPLGQQNQGGAAGPPNPPFPLPGGTTAPPVTNASPSGEGPFHSPYMNVNDHLAPRAGTASPSAGRRVSTLTGNSARPQVTGNNPDGASPSGYGPLDLPRMTFVPRVQKP
jgi:hypothetical protein